LNKLAKSCTWKCKVQGPRWSSTPLSSEVIMW